MTSNSMMSKLYSLFAPSKERNTRYVRVLVIVAVIVLVVGLSIFGYRWYRLNQEERAQEAFSACMNEYEKAERDEKLWPNAELVFRQGYQENSSTAIAPHFLAFQAEALSRMNKPEEARMAMEKAASLLSSSSPVYHMYKTKHALMMLEAADATVSQKGLELLIQQAHDETNANRDMALYYLGLYYLEKDELQKAIIEWKTLKQVASQTPESPWAQLALEKANIDVI